jgi:hypothetical protein
MLQVAVIKEVSRHRVEGSFYSDVGRDKAFSRSRQA